MLIMQPTFFLREMVCKINIHRGALFFCSIACISTARGFYPTDSSLIIGLRNPIVSHRPNNARLTPLTGTKLMNKYRASINDDADDFSSFNNLGQGGWDDGGRRLAREFYQELQNRQSLSPSSSSREGKIVEDVSCGEDAKASTTKSSGNSKSKFYDKKRKEATASPDSSSPFLSFLSFFSPAPPRPAPSAGLFSGSGITVYSSGRSIRAEIEMLETTLKRNDDQRNTNKSNWVGLLSGMQQNGVGSGGDYAPQQSDEVFRIFVALLIVLSTTYIVFAICGITEAMTWESSSASVRHGMSLLNDATESSIVVSVRHSDMFMEEKADWLIRQSSDWATLAADAVVRSAGELVLP